MAAAAESKSEELDPGGWALTVVVGDSETDLEWAEKLGVKFLAVSTGARSEEYWRRRGVAAHAHAGLALKSLSLA